MKTVSVLLVCAVIAFNCATSLATEPVAKAPSKRIAMVKVGEVDAKLFERVAKYVGQKSGVPVRVVEPQAAKEKKLEKLAEETAKFKMTDDICLLIVVAAPTNVVLNGFVNEKIGVGIVNVTQLAPSKSGAAVAEQFNRLVEKEVLCVLGLVLGLKPCPFPRCCMYSDATDPLRFEFSRDYCPPCHGKLENLLTQRGVKFEGQGKPESP